MPFLPLILLTGSIAFVNMILSGDNVLVIGTLLAMISPDRRWLVLALGGSGAVVLRIICTLFVASWLDSSWMQVIGGLLLLFIAMRLLISNQEQNIVQPVAAPSMIELQCFVKRPGAIQCLVQVSKRVIVSKRSFVQKGCLGGVVAIVVADSTTSVDNIIAVGAIGATSGINCLPLIFGLALSMTVLFLVSTRLALLIQRLPWLTFVASLIVTIRAGGLINAAVYSIFRSTSLSLGHSFFSLQWLLYAMCCLPVIFLQLRYFLLKIDRKREM